MRVSGARPEGFPDLPRSRAHPATAGPGAPRTDSPPIGNGVRIGFGLAAGGWTLPSPWTGLAPLTQKNRPPAAQGVTRIVVAGDRGECLRRDLRLHHASSSAIESATGRLRT